MRLLFLILICPLLNLAAATVLPVGPITFDSNSDYDNNFKESPSLNGAFRSPNGYIEVSGVPTATAAFDMSSIGGINGSGGTGGSDLNNDFANFTISADVASSVAGGIGASFLLRLNSSEAGGYIAGVRTQGTTAVTFTIGEGASLTSAGPPPIFSAFVPLTGLTIAANTFYPFKVSISGGAFSFDFGSGAAISSFTDPTVSTTIGQVGFVLDTISPSAATRLKNFTVVPEPSSVLLLLLSMAGFLSLRLAHSGLTKRCSERSGRVTCSALASLVAEHAPHPTRR